MVVEIERNAPAAGKPKERKRKKGKKRPRETPVPKVPTGKKVRLKNVPPSNINSAQYFEWHHKHQAPQLTELELEVNGKLSMENFEDDVQSVQGIVDLLKKTPPRKLKCLVITRSARRCCELIKQGFGPARIPVVKLFAKHMKISEQQEAISSTTSSVAIGTPNRIMKLMELDSLPTDSFEYIALDLGPDTKGFTLLTTPIVGEDFFTLYRNYLSEAVAKEAKAKFVLVQS